jgi:TonB family protein
VVKTRIFKLPLRYILKMKSLLLFLLLFPTICSAQHNKRGTIRVRKPHCVLSKTNPLFYEKVDTMPDFPGGGLKGDEWMRANLVYPKNAQIAGITGKVLVSFVVMPDGTLAETKIKSTTDTVFNAEAMRLVTKMPKWKPGKCGGDKVPVQMTMPMNFGLR